MGKNNDSTVRDDVIEVGGGEFRRVKNGLDETQVIPFINDIISQRDALIQREEHLSSLTKLAEKTISEADNLATEIKEETVKQAESDAAEILAKAEEQAQQMIEEKRTEIIDSATEEAAAIKAEAERNAELLLENQRNKIQPELSNFVHQLSSHLLAELERLTQQAVSLGAELEQKLSQLDEGNDTVPEDVDEIPDNFMGLMQTVDQKDSDEHDERVALIADDLDTTSEGEPQWELEILPPMDIMKVMAVVTHLDSIPEVEKTEIIPRSDKPSIVVFLREPIQLNDIMKDIPEVTQVIESVDDAENANGWPKKLQIELSGQTTVSQEGK